MGRFSQPLPAPAHAPALARKNCTHSQVSSGPRSTSSIVATSVLFRVEFGACGARRCPILGAGATGAGLVGGRRVAGGGRRVAGELSPRGYVRAGHGPGVRSLAVGTSSRPVPMARRVSEFGTCGSGVCHRYRTRCVVGFCRDVSADVCAGGRLGDRVGVKEALPRSVSVVEGSATGTDLEVASSVGARGTDLEVCAGNQPAMPAVSSHRLFPTPGAYVVDRGGRPARPGYVPRTVAVSSRSPGIPRPWGTSVCADDITKFCHRQKPRHRTGWANLAV